MNDKKTSNEDSAALSAPYMEHDFREKLAAKTQDEPHDSRFSIHVHSRRKRPTDADGVSAKAAIDGIVNAGILKDDSPKEVKKVSYSQEKSSFDETIIEIWEE